jgi:hypothetical protein
VTGCSAIQFSMTYLIDRAIAECIVKALRLCIKDVGAEFFLCTHPCSK